MRNKFQQGFTITELLVSVAIGLVLIAGITTYYVSMLNTSGESLRIAKLNQSLRAAMDLMVNDIRRAGYWSAPSNHYRNSGGINDNEFMQGSADLTIGAKSDQPVKSCITFAYDANKNGTLDLSADDLEESEEGGVYQLERFGFRLNDRTATTKTIQMRFSGKDTELTCNNGTWWDMMDEDIAISALVFEHPVSEIEELPGTGRIIIRKVNITISGHLVTDPTMTRTINETVRVRNDKFEP